MNIRNSTNLMIATALQEAVAEYPVEGLDVEIKYCPRGTRRYASGTYYRRTNGYENGKLIRVRVNRDNRYPVEVSFKTSQYYTKKDSRGHETIYQKMRRVKLHSPEELVLAIFLHEFSHYLDHVEGRNGRYKQTKADKFALCILERLGVIGRE